MQNTSRVDYKSALSVIKERPSHEQELKMTLKKLSERQLQIQQCKELEAHYSFMAKIKEVLPAESSSTDTPLEQNTSQVKSSYLCTGIRMTKSHRNYKGYMPVINVSASKKPERQIPTGHRFSNKKTTTIPEKTMNPISCLRWQLTGRILKTVGLRWVPTGKFFNSCTSKVESEPTHGSNVDIHHIHACKQALDLSAVPDMVPQMMKLFLQKTFDRSRSSLGLHGNDARSSSEKTDSSQQLGLEFSFSPLLEEYYIQHTVKLGTTTMIKHRMASFKKLNLSIVFWKTNLAVQQRRLLVTDLEMCLFASHQSSRKILPSKESLYGLKQAPRAWFLMNFSLPESKGVLKVQSTTLFKIKYGDDILLVQIYVDDIIFGSTNPKYSKRFEKLMHSIFEMSLIGEMKFFLGLQIHQSQKGIFINQAKYALEILKKHNMENCHSIGTPLATKPKLDVDLSGEPVDQFDYRSKIGSLMYLTSSRLDLVQAVCYCARYQARPTQKHLEEVKRIFKYLKGTINMGLWYPKDSGFELTAFLDADHAGCIDTRKSTSGGIQYLGDKLVS
ncbi:retrovirus-related pol polyprotein from transposon TNT 1-94 [Tanacetum coccineum]